MMAYKVYYQEEFIHPDYVEIVKDGSMLKFVNFMIENGQVTEDTMNDWKNCHDHLPQTEEEAIFLIETDGYCVEKIKVFE